MRRDGSIVTLGPLLLTHQTLYKTRWILITKAPCISQLLVFRIFNIRRSPSPPQYRQACWQPDWTLFQCLVFSTVWNNLYFFTRENTYFSWSLNLNMHWVSLSFLSLWRWNPKKNLKFLFKSDFQFAFELLHGYLCEIQPNACVLVFL